MSAGECMGGLRALQVAGVGSFVEQRPLWMRQRVWQIVVRFGADKLFFFFFFALSP
jgi:hypothetical protein